MDRPGSRRRLGIALLASAGVMACLGALCFGGIIPVRGDARVLVGGALMAAAVVDALVGVMMIRQA
jgi:hypothetical protein